MSRVKEFVAAISVPRQGRSELEPWVNAALDRKLATLTGPRGGRYEPVGEVYGREAGEMGRDFDFNTVTVVARRRGRYVRPRKEA